MGTISTRLPEELETELERYVEDERLDRSTAVRKLLSEGLAEWRHEQALQQLESGSVTFLEAADRAGMTVWEFARLAEERGVTWVGEGHLADDLDDLEELDADGR
jgi:metal-responsive CopG/Arc/MetJ family transcriptional regulator